MPTESLKHRRFVRMLPGRIRIEFYGLHNNPDTAQQIQAELSVWTGITLVRACPLSGRVLLTYDQRQLKAEQVLERIEQLEEELSQPCGDPKPFRAHDAPPTREQSSPSPDASYAKREAAAAAEPPEASCVAGASDRMPLPLALSMGGLAVLGAKLLLLGRSALARSPAPFYLSAGLSVITGYPLLRRGFHSFAKERRWNADLLLGTGALALALVRENLIVLAGIGLLQYVEWKRNQVAANRSPAVLPPEIKRYTENANKWGLIGAGATLTLTRDPLRAVAVLLAANPRPAFIPAEYGWQQAELVCAENRALLPDSGSLSKLARTKTLLLEDASSLYRDESEEIQCLTKETEPDKAICLTASLLEKSSHPWKAELSEKARRTCRTLRTAFQVEESAEGVQGKISGSRVFAGSYAYCQEQGIDCGMYELEAKRLARQGSDVLFIGVKAESSGGTCIGLLSKKRQLHSAHAPLIRELKAQGWSIGALSCSEGTDISLLERQGLDTHWLSLQPGEWAERLAAGVPRGENALLVTSGDASPVHALCQEYGIPSITVQQLSELPRTLELAARMDRSVHRNYRLTAIWNMLGSALAAFGFIRAPLVNLASDALSLAFMSAFRQTSERAALPQLVTGDREAAATAEAPVLWHEAPWERAVSHYGTDTGRGLESKQVHALRSAHGSNHLEGRPPTPWIASFLGQFKEFTTLILLGTTALSFFTGGLYDGIAMSAVLLANAAVGTMQERKAEQVIESLNRYQPPTCKVLRNGTLEEISALELVPGDIVQLEAGDRVPADIRLVESYNLQVSEAALTGESVPVPKQEAPVNGALPLAERSNMIYMGTDVTRGKATGVVVQTGLHTEMGRLMSLLQNDEKELTPLQKQVTSISKKFIKGALIVCGIVFATGLLRGIPLMEMISTSIALAASAIPEGLPVTITIALSAGIFRMARKQALVRKLSALETLGRTTVICSDKTGTLTKNEMTVRHVISLNRSWEVGGTGYDPSGEIRRTAVSGRAVAALEQSPQQPELARILQISLLCNNAKLEQDDEGHWIVKGDPTEGALLTFAAKAGTRPETMRQWHRGKEIPFDSNTGKMSVVCKDTAGTESQDCYVFTKGAVEMLLQRCTQVQSDGRLLELTEERKRIILEQNGKLSGEALRVLGFAYRPLTDGDLPEPDERDMIFVGMVGMMDPPKPEAAHSIQEALALGVKPVMITGDHPITAISIARQLGMYDGSQRVLSGHELDRMTDEELQEAVEHTAIFARVSPEHKLRIVRAFQQRGHLVAMTGDGINDTPAIKQANVGIAMGRTGTEVTKQTADMVLKEDDFGTIVEAVKEGRTIMGNIRKALGCLLTGNLAEIIVSSAAVILGMPLPLVPVQILLMNLITDALPAMVLAINPGNKTKLTERVEIADGKLYRKVFTRGALLGLGSLGLFAASLASGVPLPAARSIAFATLVSGQLMQTFSWRQEGSAESVKDWSQDRFLVGALGVSWLSLLAALYIPPAARFFHAAPIAWSHWIPVLAVAGSVTLLSKPLVAWIESERPGAPKPVRQMRTAVGA
ncbi:HAD family hydrolase [Paenibacillus elgii]|uniref:P-type Ca(2+) transporter n=1 Tax=Paenibacillus elgii TaxID=189691 RepID=A0A161SGH5_9BACL|nr:HAD-IC family P-type ATPase [Paenibacillus elgii]KZE80355.1 HAD family hydrolase [Paenibacillus elgii]